MNTIVIFNYMQNHVGMELCIYQDMGYLVPWGEYYQFFSCRAREIVGFAGSGPIFETENRFISRQEAEKSVHKTLYFQNFAIYRLTL